MERKDRRKYVYCIVKSAVLRKKDGSFVCSIPFGSSFHVLADVENGLYYGETYIKTGKRSSAKYRGFVNANGFTEEKVIDMAYLHYRNKTGQRIPTTMRYKGHASGFIEQDEEIHVIAQVDGWMLTGKGWTKAVWMQKVREIYDYESMKTLVYAVITQAVTDYQSIIRNLQSGIRYYTKDLPDCIAEMGLIRKFFINGDYLKIIDDQYTGEERLEQIDHDLGVTDEWTKQMLSKRKVTKH